MAETPENETPEETAEDQPEKRLGEKILDAERAKEAVLGVGEGSPTGEVSPLSEEEVQARRKRNIAIALGIAGFIAIVYLTTIFRYVANNASGS